MKRIYLLLAILLGSLQLANAQQQTLQFNKDGKFKIASLPMFIISIMILVRMYRSNVSIRYWIWKSPTLFFLREM